MRKLALATNTFGGSVSPPVFVDGLTAGIDVAMDGSSER
jgi:hypothetical protein